MKDRKEIGGILYDPSK